jgi:hypothetical protein
MWWKVPARLYWDLLTNERYQPACHYFLKSEKIPALLYKGKGPEYRPFRNFRPVHTAWRQFCSRSLSGVRIGFKAGPVEATCQRRTYKETIWVCILPGFFRGTRDSSYILPRGRMWLDQSQIIQHLAPIGWASWQPAPTGKSNSTNACCYLKAHFLGPKTGKTQHMPTNASFTRSYPLWENTRCLK